MFNNKQKSQQDYFKDIIDLSDKLYNEFPNKFKDIWINSGINDINFSSIEPLDLTMIILFGSSPNKNIVSKKINYNKNKNTLKTIIKSSSSFYETVLFVKELVILISDYLWKVEELVSLSDPNKNEEFIMNEIEYGRLKDMIDSYVSEVNHIRNKALTLSVLANNSDNIFNHAVSLNNIKRDTLNRFYFSHVHDLKNNVSLFPKELMLFGEIDNMMRHFDNIFNFLFGDFISIYQTIINHSEHLASIKQK